jgi:hypothetical protein
MKATKLAFLVRNHGGYEHFNKILRIANHVPLLAEVLRELIAKTRALHIIDLCSPDCHELLQRLVPENGFVSLKVLKYVNFISSLLGIDLKLFPYLDMRIANQYYPLI